jgi:hypothetical protein
MLRVLITLALGFAKWSRPKRADESTHASRIATRGPTDGS